MMFSCDTPLFSCRIAPLGGVRPLPSRYSATGVPKRQLEFLTGRALAEQCLTAQGASETYVARGDNRAPIWPDGFCGSISHSDQLCAAIAGRAENVPGIGVDLAEEKSVEAALSDVVCHPDDDPQLTLTELFCAKEAFYKLWHPVTDVFLEFRDVVLRIDDGHITAEVMKAHRPSDKLSGTTGRIWRVAGHHLSAFSAGPHAIEALNTLGHMLKIEQGA
ncbi:4'-phosphopantetheinyl transferase family protein [Sagittula sp. SSi028]|uniref:4'-phosphopantetheinyl transferase family protein n=1 Tax=Sagittula sp. SSi028 TaxID=3400636 RepID=UPI003AF77C8E